MVVSFLWIHPQSRYVARNGAPEAEPGPSGMDSGAEDELMSSFRRPDGVWFGDATKPARLICRSPPCGSLVSSLACFRIARARWSGGAENATSTPARHPADPRWRVTSPVPSRSRRASPSTSKCSRGRSRRRRPRLGPKSARSAGLPALPPEALSAALYGSSRRAWRTPYADATRPSAR